MERTALSNLRRTKTFPGFVACTRIRTFATAIALIAGCGGSPGNGPIDEPSVPGNPVGEVLTGVLGAPPTAGVSYETPSLSGVTDEDGSFEYRGGESVRFFLGDTTLGEAAGQEGVSPFDLAGIEPLTTGVRGFEESRAQVSLAANVATLLQTFDYDADPTNGIEVTPEVAALFEGVEVDLERDIFDFAQEQTFRSVLNRANDAELLDGHRRPRGGIVVLNDLYAELELSPGFFAPKSATIDEDGNGEINTMREYTYGEQRSQVVLTNLDSNGKQTTTTVDFDENGAQLSEVKSEALGEVIFSKRSVTDADGNVVLVAHDLHDDGIVDSSTTHSHNEFGHVLRIEHDDDADGTADRVGRYEYDERGNQSRFEWDSDVDGAPERVEFRVWSEERNLLSLEVDGDGDGWFESFELFDYDEDGRLLGRALYPSGETNPNRLRLWEYDADGLLTRASEDADGDGRFETIVQYEAGRRIAERVDEDGDGEIDQVQTWAYDADGNESRLEYDLDGDGSADHAVNYAYDEDGNRVLEEIDSGADGSPENIVRRSFAPTGWGYLFYELRDRLPN